MVIKTDTERVRLSRRLVLEFLASSVDVSTSPQIHEYIRRYDAKPERFGMPEAGNAEHRNDAHARDTITSRPKARHRPLHSPSRSTTICTSGITANAFCATSAFRHVVSKRKIHLLLLLPGAVSMPAFPPNITCHYLILPACTAATALAYVRPAR